MDEKDTKKKVFEKISNKLFFGFLILALLVAIAGFFLVSLSYTILEESEGGNTVLFTQETMDKIDRTIFYRIEQYESPRTNISIIKAMEKSKI